MVEEGEPQGTKGEKDLTAEIAEHAETIIAKTLK
jgi:hypothetical protein